MCIRDRYMGMKEAEPGTRSRKRRKMNEDYDLDVNHPNPTAENIGEQTIQDETRLAPNDSSIHFISDPFSNQASSIFKQEVSIEEESRTELSQGQVNGSLSLKNERQNIEYLQPTQINFEGSDSKWSVIWTCFCLGDEELQHNAYRPLLFGDEI
eukprot:TRINITY_DN19519_c0_g1_i1.p1 TRINITY_DN19519_c0_g1~~TRINITY_DN19519_c0_g1_i1.p1  ORF type:complete len:154 (+),score=32.21 TRINITY_DN19519_c0_g1_i1:61-522(+)